MDSHIRSIKVWWEMGYGSGLAREVENLVWCEALSGPGDSMLGGRRLGLVQGILETSPGHSVKSGNTWFQCVSHLLHSRARQCPHNFAFVTLELLKVSEETETKKTKKSFGMCVCDGNPKISPFATVPLHKPPSCECVWVLNSCRVHGMMLVEILQVSKT